MQRIELYDHNKTAYDKVEAMLAEDGKAAVIHPTGTGKSFIAFALVEAHPDKKFLWLAPSEYIYSLQTRKLAEKQGIRFDNIEFHTYVWLMRNIDAVLAGSSYDYIILDEFHRAGAQEWGRSVERLIGACPEAKLFGMSATNVRYLDNQRDMADELFEGAVASEMSLCSAMAGHILPEPKYVISVYSYEEKLRGYGEQAAKLKNRRQKTKTEQLIEKLRRALQQADGLDVIFEKHLPRRDAKMIIFCANAEHMHEIMKKTGEWFRKVDKEPHTYSVYTYNPDSEQDFRRFVEDDSGHLKLLYCIDMLNEGIHVDDVDAVVLCRPTVSPIVYKQQIGRAIAAGSTKKPVIFDMVNNFENLYQIDALKEEFDELVQMYGSVGGGDYDPGAFEVIDELRDCRELMDQIQRNLDSAWDIYYQELCRYVKKNGTTRVSRRYVTDGGLYLGRWMQRQRALYSENKLPEVRIRLMEMIGMVWEADLDQRFEHWIDLLRQYQAEHGDLAVPSRYETPEGEKLGNWCCNIRGRYKRGRVSQERIDLLNEMGFVWESFGLYWEDGYDHAKAYFDEHGDLGAPKRYECGDGFRLGLWLYTQRAVRGGKVPGNLTKEKIELLDTLGMVWEGRSNDCFGQYLAAFRKYKETHGDVVIPFHYVDAEGMQLGQWAARMNRQYFSGKLPEEKKAELLEAGFEFHSFSGQWYRQYLEAEAYYKKHGDLHVPVTYTQEHGGTLSQWVNNQRKEYRRPGHGKLSADQVELLENIHIEYGDRFEKSFDRGVEEFRKYAMAYHDNLVPSEYTTPEGYNLGRWLCHQRTKYNNGELTPDQIRTLEEAGMIWENMETVRAVRYWNVMYETAKQYADEHGSLKGMPCDYMTDDGRKLGSWVAQQRRIRKGTIRHSIDLDEEKIGMLDAIGMNWGRSAAAR